MTTDHTPDPKWTTDLLWTYLHGKAGNHDRIYRNMLLNSDHSNPIIPPAYPNWQKAVDSKIPWNQLNRNFLVDMLRLGYGRDSTLCCGVAVKRFLQKYMKTYPPSGEPWINPFYETFSIKNPPPPKNKRIYTAIKFDKKEIKKGVNLTKKLLGKGIAVRIPLIHTSKKFSFDKFNSSRIAAHHYVGIVGYDGGDYFLYIDPWPGFSGTYKYAEQNSKFLGIMQYDGNILKCDRPGTQAADCVAIAAPTWVPKGII